MQLSSHIWGPILALSALLTQVLSKQVWDWDWVEESQQDTLRDTLPPAATSTVPRCLCSIELEDDRGSYSLGEVESFTDIPLGGSIDHDTCRTLRHQCKHACALKADLYRMPAEAGGSQLGYTMCVHHGQVTSSRGVGVSSSAVLEGCAQHVPITPSPASQRLCCGHTTITTQPEHSQNPKQYYVFGWNPDCKAQSFILH